MTEEEFSNLFNDEELNLLDQLGDSLRSEPPLELPPDFASQTARGIETRFEKLSRLTKLAVRMETVLEAPMTSARALPWSLGLLAGTAGTGLLGQVPLAVIGLLLLLLALVWMAGWAGNAPGTPKIRGDRRAQLFYLMPVLSAVSVGVLCGGMLAALGSNWNLGMLGPAVGVAVFAFLVAALSPTWKALQRHCIGRPRWIFGAQLLHSVLPTVLAGYAWTATKQEASSVWICLLFLLPTVALTLLLGSRSPVEQEGRPALWRALSTSLRSLVIGSVPIGAVLAIAYQANLTRQLDHPELVEKIRQEVPAWVAQQQAIPADQNGWIDLQPAFTGQDPDLKEKLALGGGLHYTSGRAEWDETAKQQYREQRAQFLEGIEIVEAALKKPQFSYVADAGFAPDVSRPDFALAQSVDGGLAELAREARDAGRVEQSLHYLELELDWSTRFRQAGIYELSRSMSENLSNIEPWVFEGKPGREQLQRMLTSLQHAEPAPGAILEAAKRNTYILDKIYLELMAGDRSRLGNSASWWEQLAPNSYWSSVHKNYLNEATASLNDLKNLGVTNGFFSSSVTGCLMGMTRFEGLKTVVALELYKVDNGHYPEQLQELVPTYLTELPRDLISPRIADKKPILGYTRKGEGYELISESPHYKSWGYKSRQSFGQDGNYEMDRQ